MNKNLHTLLYIFLFSGLGLFSYLLLVNYTNLPPNVMAALSSVSGLLFFVVAFNILGYATIRLSNWTNEQYIRYITKRWRTATIYVIVSLMLFILNYGVLVSAKLLVDASHPFSFPNGGIRILIIVWLVELVILGLIIVNKSIKNTLKLQQQAADLQAENNKARYAALQSQLNPHFLFNSLNTLIAEIEFEPQAAIVFTRNLSDVYRYVLQCQDKRLVTLAEELAFLEAYLFLHKVRLGDCITLENKIPDSFNESQLPPLTLQLLVENVIKHNTITPSKPMVIEMKIVDNHLVMSNTLHAKKNTETSGIGLKNLSNRYNLIMGQEILVAHDETHFMITIPLLYE